MTPTIETTMVYAVFKNADMTEGRGPMVLDSIFSDEEEAWKYANQQGGVMGRRPNKGDWRTQKYSDWEVRQFEVHADGSNLMAIRRDKIKQQALRKLTSEEKEALGLREVSGG